MNRIARLLRSLTRPTGRPQSPRLGLESLEVRSVPATVQFVGPGGITSQISLNGNGSQSLVAPAGFAGHTVAPIPPGSGYSPTLLGQLQDSTPGVGNSLTGVSTYFNVWDTGNPDVLNHLFGTADRPVVSLHIQPGFYLQAGVPAATGTFAAGTSDATGQAGSDLTVRIVPEGTEQVGDPVTLVLRASFVRVSYGYSPPAQGVGDPNLTMTYSAGYSVNGQAGTLLSGTHAPPGGPMTETGPGVVRINTTIGSAFGISMLAVGGGTSAGATGPGLIGEMYYTIGFAEPGPDLATDPATGVSVRPDGTAIDATYSVLNAAPPGEMSIGYYWAKQSPGGTPVPIGPAALTATLSGADVAVGSHTLSSIPLVNLGARPADATHILMRLDPADAITETDETNNAAWVELPAAGDLSAGIDGGRIVPARATDLHLNHFFGTERLNLPVTIRNGTDAPVTGAVKVEVFLSTSADMTGIVGNALASRTVNLRALGAGQQYAVNDLAATISAKTTRALTVGDDYHFVVKITPQGDLARDDDPADNVDGTADPFGYVGTPRYRTAFDDGTYFRIVRETLNDDTTRITTAHPGIDLTDPRSFIGAFEGDRTYAYLDGRGIPTIGVGINLQTLTADLRRELADGVRAYYAANYPRQNLTRMTDDQVVQMLIRQARTNTPRRHVDVIDDATDQALFDTAYTDHRTRTLQGIDQTVFDGLATREQIALVDQVYNTGTLFGSVASAVEEGDFVLAGFNLVDKLRTQQGYTDRSPGVFLRLQAEYYNLLNGHTTALGSIM